MGDDKYYTIQVKGTAYRFEPLAQEQLAKFAIVANMGASPTKTIKVLTHVLGKSAGAEQWDAITDRLIDDEIVMKDLVEVFGKLVKRQNKDAPADDAE